MDVIDFPTQDLAACSLEELARGWAGLGLGGDLCAGPIEPGQQVAGRPPLGMGTLLGMDCFV